MRTALAALALAALFLTSTTAASPPRLKVEQLAWNGPALVLSAPGRAIFLMDAVTGQTRRLTKRGSGTGEAYWSPDGHTLAFVAHDWLCTIQSDGRGLRSLGKGAGPRWSHDGRRLAFYRPDDGLYVVDIPSGNAHKLARSKYGAWLGTPAWSPDDRRIAFIACSAPPFSKSCEHFLALDVFTVGANGKHRHRVTLKSGQTQCVDWSRTGLLAYADGSTGVTIVGKRRWRISLTAACPVWSPDGHVLATPDGTFGATLYTEHGRLVRRLRVLPHRMQEYGELAWSRDGLRLAYLLLDGPLYVIGTDGSNRRRLIP